MLHRHNFKLDSKVFLSSRFHVSYLVQNMQECLHPNSTLAAPQSHLEKAVESLGSQF